MSYYDFLTNRGVIVPDTSSVLSDTQEEFKELFGEDLDVSPETPQGRLIELITRCKVFVLQTAAASSNVFNLNKASGFGLDDLGSLFLLSRHPATYTTVSVAVTGVEGTIIPAGTRVQNTDGDIFVCNEDYVIGSPLSAVFRAEKTGEIPCPVNTLNIILDAVNGLETVNNPAPAILGSDQESDVDFRNRIKTSLNVNSISVISAIKANLDALSGVKGTFLYDNYSNASIEVDSITVPAHSILAVVDGGDPEKIAQVLYNKKTIGAGYCSTSTDPEITIVTQTVLDPISGTSYEVKFARPRLVNLVVEITVARQDYAGSDLETDIKKAIADWATGENSEVDGIKIGKDVSPFEISAAVSNSIPEIFIRDCKIGIVDGEPAEASVITMDEADKGVIESANITVTII